MGRPSTGAWTVYESLRIELTYLLKQGYIKKGHMISGSLHWSNQRDEPTGSIAFISNYTGEFGGNYLEVRYTVTERSGSKTSHRYKIGLCEQPSNLGKGYTLYFSCPQTGRKCRILYKAYDSDLFKSRQAYRNRLYYDCQQASKLNKYNENYWRIDKHIKKLKEKGGGWKRSYNGKPTKAALRYYRLISKQERMDMLRWSPLGVPKVLRKSLAMFGLGNAKYP